jgi:hypothetical protein
MARKSPMTFRNLPIEMGTVSMEVSTMALIGLSSMCSARSR